MFVGVFGPSVDWLKLSRNKKLRPLPESIIMDLILIGLRATEQSVLIHLGMDVIVK